MRSSVLAIAAAALVGCSSLTPTSDPVYLRINDIEARLIRIERVLENESLIELAGDISSLREELRQMLGEVETLGIELDNQSQRQLDLYVDLDERLAAIEEAQDRMSSVGGQAASGGAAGATDQQAYDAAFAMIQQQNWSDAQSAFQTFLASYPSSTLRGNAQYWLGESHYAQLDFPTALTAFQRVLDDYPRSNKIPDALLKIGFSHYELGNRDQARQALLRVVREFSDTSAASSANERLQRIAEEAD